MSCIQYADGAKVVYAIRVAGLRIRVIAERAHATKGDSTGSWVATDLNREGRLALLKAPEHQKVEQRPPAQPRGRQL